MIFQKILLVEPSNQQLINYTTNSAAGTYFRQFWKKKISIFLSDLQAVQKELNSVRSIHDS